MSDNPGETVNYLRLLSMYMDLGTETVHDVFVYHSPGKDPHTFLKSKEETLIKLKNKRILNPQQCELLLKEDTSGNCTLKYQINLKDFDISLLTTLAINLFTNIQLPLPRKGWDNPPRNNDKSIAADLLRLRITRNVIVGHHPKARLSQDRFEEEWENVSEILLRIQQQITQGNGASFQEKIDSYGSQIKTREEYNEKLSDWHDDMSKRQDEVEDLKRKLEGFDAYFKSKCDRYERYIKLLVQGGTFVLSSFLDEQIKRRGRDLRSVLDENKVTLMQSITDPQHLDVLYPSQTNGQSGPLDITTWNVSILATVILQLFDKDIGKDIKLEISMIGDAYRNYADSVFVALDSNIFEDYVTDLKASLKIVSGKLGGDKANQYYQILADSKKQIGEHEFQTYMDELKSQGKQMKKFTDVFKETLQKTKDYLKDMIAQGISFKSSHELDLKMITVGTDEEKKQLAENILTEIWHEALDRSTIQNPDFADMEKEVRNILDEIRKFKSVEKMRVEQKCIILQISCTSPSDMLCLIDYFESSEFHESLDIISKELGYHFSTAFAIKAFIPVDNLWDILNHRSDLAVVKEEGIRVPISVSSPAGMLKLRSLFNSETIANSTNAIADALSKHLNETVTLKVETDMKSFTDIFDEGSDSSSNSSLSESNILSSTQHILSNEPGDCLEEQSHTSNEETPLEDKTENENKTILIDKLVICKDDVRNLVDDTAKTAQGKIRTEKYEYKKEAEKPELEPIKMTNSFSKETEKSIETQGQLSMSELDKALSYSDGEKEKQTNESVSQLQAEEVAGVKMVTSKAEEPLHQIREKLLTGDEEKYNKRKPDDTGSDSSSDSSISESNIQSSTQLIPSYETGEYFEEQSHTSSDENPLEDKPENENKTILIRLNKAIHNQVPDLQQTIDEMKTSSVYADAEKIIEIAAHKMRERKIDVEPKKTKLTKYTQIRVTDIESHISKDPEKVTRKLQRDLKEDLITYYNSEHNTEEKDTPVVNFYVMPDINIIEIQGPLSHEKEVKIPIRSLSDVFMKDGEFSREVYLTADAGYGKTAFSQYLALIWCQAHSPDSRYTEYFDEDHLIAMHQFGLLFLVTLRDSTDDCSIDEMILNQVIKTSTNSDIMNMTSLHAVLHRERYLVILDGLDEWTHPEGKCKWLQKSIPHRIARGNGVFLTTTRPWKLGVISLRTSQIDKKIELAKQSSESAELIKRRYISKIKGLDTRQARKLVKKFNAEVEKCNLGDLESVPLLLIYLINLWCHNIQLGQSRSEMYNNITELFLSRTIGIYPYLELMNEHSQIEFPQCLSSNYKHCEKYFSLLTALGRLAFHTLLSKTRENTLVFDSSIAEQFLSESELKFFLRSGITTQSKVQVSALEQTSKTSFVHKSVQEYFSALYMSRQSESDVQVIIQENCRSLQDILDMSAVFVFISGMNAEMMSTISRELMSVITENEKTIAYRCKAEYDYGSYESSPLKDIQNMYISCIKENPDNNDVKLCLQDFFIDRECSQEHYSTTLQRLTKQNKNNIKSVSVLNRDFGSLHEIIDSFELSDLNHLQKINCLHDCEEEDIVRLLSGTVKYAGVDAGVYSLYHRFSMTSALCRKFQTLHQLEGINISKFEMSHDVLEEFLSYLTNRKSMKEIRLEWLSCTDHRTSCDGVKLDLSQHAQLRTLVLYKIHLSQLSVNVTSLEECKVRGLPKPGLVSSSQSAASSQ